jgi:hypothetical protein
MTKLNNTNKKLTLLNQNIFDPKLRIQFNINNTIDYNTETDLFLHNFIDINIDNSISTIINEFNEEILALRKD